MAKPAPVAGKSVYLLSRGSGVRISPGAPLISLESRTCSHFWNGLKFDFRPIRSNNAGFGRKFKT